MLVARNGLLESDRIRCALISQITEALAHLILVLFILKLFKLLCCQLLLFLSYLMLIQECLLIAG